MDQKQNPSKHVSTAKYRAPDSPLTPFHSEILIFCNRIVSLTKQSAEQPQPLKSKASFETLKSQSVFDEKAYVNAKNSHLQRTKWRQTIHQTNTKTIRSWNKSDQRGCSSSIPFIKNKLPESLQVSVIEAKIPTNSSYSMHHQPRSTSLGLSIYVEKH